MATVFWTNPIDNPKRPSLPSTSLGKIIPILRSFDGAKAGELCADFLGFKVDWDYRFADDLPLYVQTSTDDCNINLSEHYGDAICELPRQISQRTRSSSGP